MAEPRKIYAKDFTNREELEEEISLLSGKTTETKPEFVIEGTVEELEKHQLAHGKRVWGIKCQATNPQTKEVFEKPHRGEKFISGINKEK